MRDVSPDRVVEVLGDFVDRLFADAQSEALDYVGRLDLSFSQARTLYLLERMDEPVPIGTVAERLGLSTAATGRCVDALVGMGVVTRAEDPDDRRVKRVALTDSGREVVLGQRDAHRGHIADFAERLPSADRERLVDVLDTILAGNALPTSTSADRGGGCFTPRRDPKPDPGGRPDRHSAHDRHPAYDAEPRTAALDAAPSTRSFHP